MQPIELKDAAAFGSEFLRLTLLQGFNRSPSAIWNC